MIDPVFWFMFPIALLFSTISMMAGIGGALLFAPYFLLVLKLDPITAITAGLIIELFGFGSGLYAFLKKRLINFHVVHRLIWVVILGTIVGVVLRHFIPSYVLIIILSLLLFMLSYLFLSKKKKCHPKHPTHIPHIHLDFFHSLPHIQLSTKFLNFFGGTLLGAVSSGLGELNEYLFNERLKLPYAVAAGTSIFLVTIAALIGSIPHLVLLFLETPTTAQKLLSIMVFTIPGVIIGAQFGVMLARRIRFKLVEHIMGCVFIFIGLSLLASLI